MKIFLVALFLCSFLFSDDFSKIREQNINNIETIIKIYKKRLNCLENNGAKECIKKLPLDRHSDQLALLISSEFPISYYKNILQRDIKNLEKEKLCWGRALNEEEVKKCIKD